MPAGDHLRVQRGAEVDHAIDAGDRTVIRWRAGVGVERVERALFAPEGAQLEVVLHRERIFRPPLVLARAFSRFAESAYRAMFQSAEQFAVWCKSAQFPPVTEAPAAPVRKAKAAPAKRPDAKAARAAPRKTAKRPARKAKPARRARAAPARQAKPARKAAPKRAAARKVVKAPRKKGRR